MSETDDYLVTGRPALPPREESILEILDERAGRLPDRRIFCYLDDGEVESESLTYRQLQRRARAIAGELQKHTVPGDRALLIYPPGLEFIAGLFGCFYAGVIAVPCCPPRADLVEDGFAPLEGIVGDCDPAAILVGEPVADFMRDACAERPAFSQCSVLVTEMMADDTVDDFPSTKIRRDTLAILQYTSGSTGDPKGVMLDHGNILQNCYAIQTSLDLRTETEPPPGARWVAVSWLPHYHDMGLIGNIIQPVYVGGLSYRFSPTILLMRPLRWLEAISRYRAVTSGGPNFAYDLCVRRITDEQKASLDLSSWHVATIGAEPVSPRTIDEFTAAFADCGFRREAFYPCYGLAESTLLVTGGDSRSEPVIRSFRPGQLEYHPDAAAEESATETASQRVQTLVGCGHPCTDHEVVIVDPETGRESRPGTVGEIWIAGPSVARGYWGRDQETQATFGALLADTTRGPFLRTGDLGFFVNGELFVCGRIKDLIVIRGQNHYPQDIEETVCQVSEHFLPKSGVALGDVQEGEERLVILQEIDRRSRDIDVDRLSRDVRRRVAERHQLQVDDLVFLQRGSLPKTTSGKVRRQEALQRYRSGRLRLWKPKVRS